MTNYYLNAYKNKEYGICVNKNFTFKLYRYIIKSGNYSKIHDYHSKKSIKVKCNIYCSTIKSTYNTLLLFCYLM